jgi:hypothetical protein
MGTNLAFARGIQCGFGSPISNHAGELLHAQFAQQRVSGGFAHQPALGPNIRIDEELPAEMAEWLRRIHEPNEGPIATPPPPALHSIVGQTGPIVFHNGVPVSGWAGLRLFADGRYDFSGHIQDSGFPSYDHAMLWIVRSNRGTAFLFRRAGRLHGTTEAGGREDDWNETGRHIQLANAWNDLCAGYSWHWEVAINMGLDELLEQAEAVVGIVKDMILLGST